MNTIQMYNQNEIRYKVSPETLRRPFLKWDLFDIASPAGDYEAHDRLWNLAWKSLRSELTSLLDPVYI